MTARVVVLSDSFPTARALESLLLAGHGEVALATRLGDAAGLCERGRGDVVIVDGTGLLDAAATCRELRRGPGRPTILVLTRPADPAARLKALDAGADELAAWPAAPAALLARVASLAELKRLRDRVERNLMLQGDAGAPPAPRPRLLVLDPDDRSRTRLAELLAPEADVTAAGLPIPGLVGAAEGRFDVAWVSLGWDGADGFHVCRQLRLVDASGHMRVLGIGAPGPVGLHTLLENGIDDVLPRPVDRCEALARTRVAAARRHLAGVALASEPHALVVRLPSSIGLRRPPDRFAA